MIIRDRITLTNVYDGKPGADGLPGKPGEDGKDGVTLYTWIKYADDANGNGISEIPDGKKYLGMAINKPVQQESNDPRDYTWSLMQGEDGIQGPPGEDGMSTYTWIRYATDANGANMSADPTGKSYIGIAYNRLVSTPSTNPKDYTWALYRGPQGVPGQDGKPGQDGQDGQDGEDSYAVTILSSGGLVFKNGKGSSTLTVKLYKGTTEYDSNGTLYTYTWEKYTNGVKDNWSATGKQININQNHVDGATTFQVKVGTVAQGQVTIADLSDVIASETEPTYKVVGSLWYKPSEGKTYIWTGTKWEVTIIPETIGGNNYFRNALFRGEDHLNLSTYGSIDSEFLYLDKYRTVKLEVRDLTVDRWAGMSNYTVNVQTFANDVWSGQVKVYIPSNNLADLSPVVMEIICLDSANNRTVTRSVFADLSLKDKWQHIKLENIKVPNNSVKVYLSCWIARNGICYFTQPQLERGTVCTDFRESVIDVQEQADELTNTVMDIEERIEDGKIISTVLGSEEANILFDSKANAEDVKDLVTDEQLQAYLDQQKKYIDDKIGGIDMTPFVNKSELQQSMKDFLFMFQQGGGVNLIKDSIGFSIDHSVWGFKYQNMETTMNPSIEALGFNSGWKWTKQAVGSKQWSQLGQKIVLNANKNYSFGMFIKKEAGVDFKIRLRDSTNQVTYKEVILPAESSYNYEYIYFTFKAITSEIYLLLEQYESPADTIGTGLMLNQGDIPMSWQSHPTEMYNANTKIDMNGVTVNRMDGDVKVGYTAMTPSEFAGYYRNPVTGQMERVFALNEDYTVTKKVIADKEINVGSLKLIYINSGGKKGVAFVPLTNPLDM